MTSPQPVSEVDPRPRRLLERYATLVGGMVMELGPDLLEVELPATELARLGRRAPLRVALSPAALDEDADAEILLVGSALLADLIEAIRTRGAHDERGLVAPTTDPGTDGAALTVPVDGATMHGVAAESLVLLPAGRLLARVSIRSGPALVERLVESGIVDLTSGTLLPAGVAAACEAAPVTGSATSPTDGRFAALPARPVEALLPLLFADLERRLANELARIGAEAERACRSELQRLDAYYGRMLEEIDPDEKPDEALDRTAAIRADHARRREETEHRFQVHATAHPIQLVRWLVPSQRATWQLRAASGDEATLSARRVLVGEAAWELACPGCGAAPEVLRVCRHGHVACGRCSARCGACGEAACRSHGAGTCEVEGHPVCDRDLRSCPSCGRGHCELHAMRCAAHDHLACASCAVGCARCGLALCRAHGIETGEGAPLGQRWLCASCTVYCEGGTNEPVGLDEVERCASCERHICHAHAATCVVDGRRHCSRHLRRSDRSGRLACEGHRASCADEPDAVLASDEVAACATCGRAVCEGHRGICTTDGQPHCRSHLAPLRDQPGAQACEPHRTTCAIDGVTFSLTGTRGCPVCRRTVCATHLAACSSCARAVCTSDIEESTCRTCRAVEIASDLADELIAASLQANRGEPVKAKEWRTARDATHTIVEAQLGWGRRLTFSVAHGESKPSTAVYRSLLGAERRR